MMQASAYGRLAADPRSIQTKTGKAMAVVNLAVNVDDDAPLWFNIIAFGRVAEDLLRHGKGDLVSVAGRVQRNTWTDANGNARERLEIVVDALISARTSRPAGGRKKREAA